MPLAPWEEGADTADPAEPEPATDPTAGPPPEGLAVEEPAAPSGEEEGAAEEAAPAKKRRSAKQRKRRLKPGRPAPPWEEPPQDGTAASSPSDMPGQAALPEGGHPQTGPTPAEGGLTSASDKPGDAPTDDEPDGGGEKEGLVRRLVASARSLRLQPLLAQLRAWVKRRKTKLAKDTPSKRSLPRVERLAFRSGKIKVLDGRSLTVVDFKRGGRATATTQWFDTDEEAIAAAARRRGTVVWCSSTALSMNKAPIAGTRHRGQRLLDAHAVSTSYGPHTAYSRSGQVIFIASLSPDLTRLLRKCKLHFSGASVAEDDCYWVRIGEDACEITMVREGEVCSWAPIASSGLRHISEQEFEDTIEKDEAISRHVQEIAGKTAGTRQQWSGRHFSLGTIWLHGPGADWMGVETSMRSATGCIIKRPPSTAIRVNDLAHVWTAALAVRSDAMRIAHSVLRRSAAKLRMIAALPWCFLIAGLVFLSCEAREDAQETQSVMEQAATIAAGAEAASLAEGDQSAARAAAALEILLEDLRRKITYPWDKVAAHAVGVNADGGVTLRCGDAVPFTASKKGGYQAMLSSDEIVRDAAIEIFGPNAVYRDTTIYSGQYDFDDAGTFEVTGVLEPPAMSCGEEAPAQ